MEQEWNRPIDWGKERGRLIQVGAEEENKKEADEEGVKFTGLSEGEEILVKVMGRRMRRRRS